MEVSLGDLRNLLESMLISALSMEYLRFKIDSKNCFCRGVDESVVGWQEKVKRVRFREQ